MTLRLLAAALLAASVPAQVTFDISHASGLLPSHRLAVTITETVASARVGGYGWVTVDVHNGHRDAHRVDIRLRDLYGRDVSFGARRSLMLEPSGDARVHLPLLGAPRNMRVSVVADGNDREGGQHQLSTGDREAAGVSALFVGDDARAAASWRESLAAAVAGFPTETIRRWENGRAVDQKLDPLRRYHHRTPADLPLTWWLLSGFDLIIVDARASLDAAVQTALADYLRAGGSLLVEHASTLDRSSVLGRVLRRERAVATGRFGFGTWAAADEAARIDAGELRRWLGDAQSGVLRAHSRERSGPVPVALGVGLEIPGLGDVPVGLFFFIVLVFAVLAGPFNYFYWKRRRRLAMLLVTVPAAGLTVTLAILGFGLLSEGLGIKGAITSITRLDQRDHTSATRTARAMYAGLTPGGLTPAAGTYVFSPEVANRSPWDGSVPHVLDFDLDGGVIGGRLLPARTVASLETASVGTERERLRFRLRGDGAVEVLQGAGLRLADGAGDRIVVRTFDGAWYGGGADGLLAPLEPGAMYARAALLWRASVGALDAEELLPGSYIALVAASPSVDALGLEVEWLAGTHVVLGQAAEEDFVRE